MRTVTASRYVAPLREGGSLPALVEADDDGLYVVKFRAGGQVAGQHRFQQWLSGQQQLARLIGGVSGTPGSPGSRCGRRGRP